jgi:hypothetical protein
VNPHPCERPKRTSRRRFLASAAAALESWRCARGDDPKVTDAASAPSFITPETQTAIDRGLEYLAHSQYADGGWGDRALYQGNLAVVGLGGLAFLAGGHHPGRGPYGKTVTRALQFIIAHEQNQPRPGFLYNPIGSNHGPMYSHGFATLFLAEAHGTITDRDLRRRVRDLLGRAVQVILNSQNGEGGWRYQPVRDQADISVTICQIMALRAARNAGVDVPKSVVDDCIKYVRSCRVSTDGGFRYFKSAGPSAFARSAAGVVALMAAGVYDPKELEPSLRYLMRSKSDGQGFARRDDIHFYYGHYYAAQAMWIAGGHWWTDWFPAIRDELLVRNRFRNDGSWSDAVVGSDYATAMACIILQIPNNYLPIMQK